MSIMLSQMIPCGHFPFSSLFWSQDLEYPIYSLSTISLYPKLILSWVLGTCVGSINVGWINKGLCSQIFHFKCPTSASQPGNIWYVTVCFLSESWLPPAGGSNAHRTQYSVDSNMSYHRGSTYFAPPTAVGPLHESALVVHIIPTKKFFLPPSFS